MRTDRVLLINAEPEIHLALRTEGVQVESVSNGAAALASIHQRGSTFDAIVLVLQRTQPLDPALLELLEEHGHHLPILLLAASEDHTDHVRSLELGADDYVAMPCEPDVLVARIHALIRRDRHLPVFIVHGMEFDVGLRTLRRGDRRVDLTPREFDVLRVLMEADGEVVSKEQLLERVWDIHTPPGTAVVEVQIARIRGKLKSLSRDLITTVIGEGYCLRN